MKNFLLIGNSSLEDAIAWKLNQENNVGNIFISPGNGGTYTKQKTRNIVLNSNDKDSIKEFLEKEKINITIASSYKNLTYEFEQALHEIGIPLIGPTSKIISFFSSRINIKNFFKKYNISSPSFEILESISSLSTMIEKYTTRKIIYSESQKGWKGAYLIDSKGQGAKILEAIQENCEKESKFIVENYQKGEEFSAILAFDKTNYILFPVIRVYPKSFDYDYGLYTSGMGGFTPSPNFSNSDITVLNEKIIYPLIEGLKTESLIYNGFLTIHFIKTSDRLLALNIIPSIHCPEIETILPLMSSSFYNLCNDLIDNSIIKYILKINQGYSLSVVLASKGYPIDSEKGILIAGLDKQYNDINIFHNKTSRINYSKNRGFITAGGRVLTLNTVSTTLENARERIYKLLENNEIFFNGNFYRSDIAEKYGKK
jgi:phosphoribosylamine--glycine ligase